MQVSHGSVLDELGSDIANGHIGEGTVLTLAALETRFGVSRTMIREAVRVIEALGMVASRRRVGVTVQPESEWSSLDSRLIQWRLAGNRRHQQIAALTELRLAIEPIAARLAAQRATHSQRQHFSDLASTLEHLGAQGKGDSEEYLAADIAFHDLLLDASGNLMLSSVKAPIADVIRGRHQLGLTPGDPKDEALHNHVETAAAILRGDADAAEHHTRGYVLAVLEEVQVPEGAASGN
ncbi:FadR/GntR family transcriptional regulator [Microbacterium sp. YY-01]|uniref:FadR/GntR family transcriptional regulator n=1 Tax=Microbacterium sp. YY-01 TaxID=3421634 RepID=UPI003D166270